MGLKQDDNSTISWLRESFKCNRNTPYKTLSEYHLPPQGDDDKSTPLKPPQGNDDNFTPICPKEDSDESMQPYLPNVVLSSWTASVLRDRRRDER